MTFLLLALLFFAVIVTMIGFFLTTKSPVRDQAPEFIGARRSRRVVDAEPWRVGRMLEPVSSHGRRVVESLPVRAGRFSTGNGISHARYVPTSTIWGRINVRQ